MICGWPAVDLSEEKGGRLVLRVAVVKYTGCFIIGQTETDLTMAFRVSRCGKGGRSGLEKIKKDPR